jgi:hypothetical protein
MKLSLSVLILMIFSTITVSLEENNILYSDFNRDEILECSTNFNVKSINIDLTFSKPEIVRYRDTYVIKVEETNHNRIIMFDYDTRIPILPVNYSVYQLPFGTKILNVEYTHSNPQTILIPGELSFGFASIDNTKFSYALGYNDIDPYPGDWITYHTGGGLFYEERATFFVLRAYPVRYYPTNNSVQYINSININVSYIEPEEPIITEQYKSDLLIISPTNFIKHLEPLVCFKEHHNIKTELYSLEEIYNSQENIGRDNQEKIKYFIKEKIEQCNIKYVLLVGGIKGQSTDWSLPIRYSYVVPESEQEYPEEKFVCDLYYADIYNSEGGFSSWDSNSDGRFSVWNSTFKEDMDIYPDVYLGRLACHNIYEVKNIVNKIINYERGKVQDKDWFKNLLLVAGDSYVNNGQWPDGIHINEGELAGKAAEEIMKDAGFCPIEVYTSKNDINRETVNSALNKGAGFAYFCGHGSRVSWSTHFPPASDKGSNWTTGYKVEDMIFLRNKEKLPVTIVGGCHNGEFDKSMMINIIEGVKNKGLKYFLKGGRFWFDGWAPKCWAWWLTVHPNGGAIATIANTGLGTHGDGDQDNNGVVDYLEILDGWLELRFLELYGKENQNILGLNHGMTITGYLHKFLGDDAKMDVKMVQQWELFGDPSLVIGGY